MIRIAAEMQESMDGQTTWLTVWHGTSGIPLIVNSGDDAANLAGRAAHDLRRRRKSVTAEDLIPVIESALKGGTN